MAESFHSKWDGHEWVIDFEFSREGKKFARHEVYSEITRNSFTQTGESAEVGRPLKRVYTIHAMRKRIGS
jgi:hypothetical protein